MAGKTPKDRRVVKGAHIKSKQRGTTRPAARAETNEARGTEVAERRQLEAALRESEQRHWGVVAAMAEGVVIQDQDGHIRSCNVSACRILGLTEDQVLARTSFDPQWRAIHENGSPFPGGTHPPMETLRTGLASANVIMGVHRPDGTLVWISINTQPITVGKDELPSGVVTSFRDITAQKQAEEHSRQSEAFVTSVFEHLPHMVFVKEASDLRFVRLNRAGESLLGKLQSELLGKTDYDFFPKSEADFFTTKDREVLANGRLVDIPEESIRTAAGPRVLHTKKLPILGVDGTPQYLLGISEDITEQKRTEESLQRTQFAMDQAVDAVYWIDPHARILYTNNAASEMLGYTADEFQHMTVHDLNPDCPPEVWPEWWAETREKKVMSLETVHLAKDGRRIPIDIRVSFLAYGGQEFHCAYVRDISERKRVDEALRASQERFQLAARATHDGIWDWNILTGEQYWSDRHLELFGLEPNPVMPTYERWIALVHPEDADRVHQATCRHLETGEPYDIEVRVRMKDGRYRWFRDQGQAQWDSTGRPVRMVGSISDVTERRNAEEAIRKAHAELEQRVDERTAELAQANRSLKDEIAERKSVEEAVREGELRYKLLTEATFDGIAIHDQGVLLDVNAGLERMFGYGPGELMGRSLLDLVADESRDLVLANMQNGVNGPYEAMGRRKDGTTFPGEVVVRPCCYRGKQVRLVAGRDITARKHLELERSRHTEELERQLAQRTAKIAKLEAQRAQAEKLAAMGRLAAGVAHEINNPIAGIKNAFELVKQAVDPAHPHAEFTAMIDREITRVTSIVQNMYQLYRPESGKGEPVELQTMIMDIKALFAKRLDQGRLLLAMDIDSRIRWLCVPRRDMLQVLLNLLHNAIDYSSEGGTIKLTVHMEPAAIRIAVSDQGTGIHPEDLPHIFDPFFTTKTGGDQKGMGLGLSISQTLVTAMGGMIEVQTQPNGGSTFSVLLPRHLVVGAQDQLNIIKEVVTHDY
ncbi:MAG: PAS domain-containing sensor histidine kinase [Nitrospira sp.]